MRIFIDIGHPAHVHYFKNFIRIMKVKGHQFFISARDKEFVHQLLTFEKLDYYNRGKGSKNLISKLLYLVKADIDLYRKARRFKPDIFLSFASPYAAHVAKVCRKPHVSLTDTDSAKLGILSFAPFTDSIITPNSFKKDFKEKHIRFNGFMELCYLHPNIFKPEISILKELGIQVGEKYILFRFVSFNANHDIGQSGFDSRSKMKIVEELSKEYKIFISSESLLPDSLKKYQIQLPPNKIHQIMASAALFIGEGATMASECAMIGTPAIYVNTLTAGTIEEQERYGLLFSFKNSEDVLEKAKEILSIKDLKAEFLKRRNNLLENKIDVTSFMVWFMENYPQSAEKMKTNPDFQNNFK